MRKYILFDLDGTISDPGEGITNSVAYALGKYGIWINDKRELYPYIGPPLSYSFARFHGLPKSEIANAVKYYREYFSDEGIFQNVLYHGIENLLETLKGEGASLMIATSKPEEFAHRILEHFHIKSYFDFVGGSTFDGERSTKAEVISHIFKMNSELSPENAIMVGDRKYDIDGAHQCDLEAAGVLYGYGDRSELERAGADYIVANVEELNKMLFAI